VFGATKPVWGKPVPKSSYDAVIIGPKQLKEMVPALNTSEAITFPETELNFRPRSVKRLSLAG
jgi:hypothetical protein